MLVEIRVILGTFSVGSASLCSGFNKMDFLQG